MTIQDALRQIVHRVPMLQKLRPVSSLPEVPSYPSYKDALATCGVGYHEKELAEIMFFKTRKIIQAQIRDRLYEPNVVLTLEALQLAHASRVLDFGGNCGLHYFLAKQETGLKFKWAVVETPVVAAASAPLESDELRFFLKIEDALAWLDAQPEIVHASGVIQYTPDPEACLVQLVEIAAPVLCIPRNAIAVGSTRITVQTSRLRDNGPGELPLGVDDREIKVPRTFIARSAFERIIQSRYRLIKHSRDDREADIISQKTKLRLGDGFTYVLQ